MWALDGSTGSGVTDLALRIILGVSRSCRVVVANGHVGSIDLAVRLDSRREGPGPAHVSLASWLPLPIEGREVWSSECSRADLVVLDTIDELWRPAGVLPEARTALARTRLLREVARASNTALLVTARQGPNCLPVGAPWLGDVLDDVADVRLKIVADAERPGPIAIVRTRHDGRTHRLDLGARIIHSRSASEGHDHVGGSEGDP